MTKIKIKFNAPNKKYILYADAESNPNGEVCIYRRFLYIFYIKIHNYPLSEMQEAIRYMNHLNNK